MTNLSFPASGSTRESYTRIYVQNILSYKLLGARVTFFLIVFMENFLLYKKIRVKKMENRNHLEEYSLLIDYISFFIYKQNKDY